MHCYQITKLLDIFTHLGYKKSDIYTDIGGIISDYLKYWRGF